VAFPGGDVVIFDRSFAKVSRALKVEPGFRLGAAAREQLRHVLIRSWVGYIDLMHDDLRRWHKRMGLDAVIGPCWMRDVLEAIPDLERFIDQPHKLADEFVYGLLGDVTKLKTKTTPGEIALRNGRAKGGAAAARIRRAKLTPRDTVMLRALHVVGAWNAAEGTKEKWGNRLLEEARISGTPRKVYGDLQKIMRKPAAQELLATLSVRGKRR
jgi:hypothetical protein